MIRESLYFSFAERKSTDFGIYNVSISEGLFQENFISNRTIQEVKIRGNDKPYFFEVTKEPISFQLSFSFLDTWDDNKLREVARWLNVGFYQPLFFSEDIDRVYYCMPIESTNLIHNGLKQGYLTLTMRCDSPFAYGHDIVTQWYDCSTSSQIIEIDNLGDLDILPEIDIVKVGDGNVSITNLSRANSQTRLTGLKNGEEIYLNGDNQLIETNLPNTYRFENFNDYYLPFYYGKNRIQISSGCKVRFQYKYKFIS
ncbi:distal tail protein Dit [Heyndrickxia camelliae]|uniref:Phage tail protein n=1 Tax=Heyndrickxia camelliae TaxID=1707093 RepID=A0A2N3LD68_9BACI|nr:distal tail protein Dit [Heyndrickxia camelliae]PKR82602.1 phage tail protein [Heyndrickxia camelliae]